MVINLYSFISIEPFIEYLAREETIQFPYTNQPSANWYNCEESYLEQLELTSSCSFLIALNMILHLRIISQIYPLFLNTAAKEEIPKHGKPLSSSANGTGTFSKTIFFIL